VFYYLHKKYDISKSMDLTYFKTPLYKIAGVDVSSLDTFFKDRESTTMQDQSQAENMTSLYWSSPSPGVTTLRTVSMYYVMV
jgi:hypothetical protein